MAKLYTLGSIATIVLALTAATISSAGAGTACSRKDFKTALIKDACQKNGQQGAKDAMKAFMKAKKIKDCKQCHSKLAPAYEIKADGFEQFKKLGGK